MIALAGRIFPLLFDAHDFILNDADSLGSKWSQFIEVTSLQYMWKYDEIISDDIIYCSDEASLR